MKAVPYKIVLFIASCAAFAASPSIAQDSMQGVDMSHMQHATKKPVKPITKKKPRPTKKMQAQEQKPAAHSMSGMAMPPQQGAPAKQHMQHAGAMPGMNMSSMQGMPMQPPPNLTGAMQKLDVGTQIGERPVVRGLGLEATGAGAMQGMPPMQGGKAPPDARSPDYSDGVGYGDMTGMDMADDQPLGMLLIDRLEVFDGRNDHGASLDAQAWYGNDENRLWLKAEGERSAGRLQDLRTEVLWDHLVATYWDTQLGARHDFGIGPGRTWAAFGVQGLAPYWFEIEATMYVGQSGRTAFRFESEYELLLTQRVILQPRFEANLYGKDDPQRGIGSGLSDAELGLRLRYEITRQFAPYVGVDFVRRFGKTADYSRVANEPVFDPQFVAGVRLWF